jgi:hypothetical protein
MIRINTQNTEHLYEIEISAAEKIEVEANTRSQAASIAKKAGFEVRSVNMIG